MREALEQQILDALRLQMRGDLDQRGAHAPQTRGVAGKIAIDAIADPFGKLLAAGGAEEQGESRGVGEGERAIPIGIGEGRKP